MTTYNVSTAAELATDLAAAGAGDEIILADGDYSNFDLDSKAVASELIIRAENQHQAKVASVDLRECAYITLRDLHIGEGSSTSPASGNLVYLAGSSDSPAADNIVIDGCQIHGDSSPLDGNTTGLDDGDYQNRYGIYGHSSTQITNITIKNCEIRYLRYGLTLYNTDGLLMEDNSLDYLGNDVMKFSALNDFTIRRQTFEGHHYRYRSVHGDFMQFENSGGISNGLVEQNVMLCRTNDAVVLQGIFMNAGTKTNVTVQDNVIYTGHRNGIKLGNTSNNCTVQRNSVLLCPGIDVNQYDDTQISGPNGTGSTKTENIWTIDAANGSIDGNGNLKVQYTDAGGDHYVDDYITDPRAQLTVTTADLAPILGTIGEDYGAADFLLGTLGGGDTLPANGLVTISTTVS